MQDLLKRLGIVSNAPSIASYNFKYFDTLFLSQRLDGRAITRFSDDTILEIDMSTPVLDGPSSFFIELKRGSSVVSLSNGRLYKSQGFDDSTSEQDKKAFAEYFTTALKHSESSRGFWPFARKEPINYNYTSLYARSRVISQYIQA